jgi:hypothetical protein
MISRGRTGGRERKREAGKKDPEKEEVERGGG